MISINAIIFSYHMFCEVYRSHPDVTDGNYPDGIHPDRGFSRLVFRLNIRPGVPELFLGVPQQFDDLPVFVLEVTQLVCQLVLGLLQQQRAVKEWELLCIEENKFDYL